jgi:hypothetical protein
VPLDREGRVPLRHAGAVVADADRRDAAPGDLDVDAGAPASRRSRRAP